MVEFLHGQEGSETEENSRDPGREGEVLMNSRERAKVPVQRNVSSARV